MGGLRVRRVAGLTTLVTMNFRIFAAALLGAAAVCAAQAQGSSNNAGNGIVVHHIGPFTGVLAASNGESLAATRLYLDNFNAAGGVQGRPVVLETVDDGQDPKKSKELFDQLI